MIIGDFDPMKNGRNHPMLTTAYDDFEYVQKGVRLHVDDYLMKPIDEDDLYNRICAIVKMKQAYYQKKWTEKRSWRIIGNASQHTIDNALRGVVCKVENYEELCQFLQKEYNYPTSLNMRVIVLYPRITSLHTDDYSEWYNYSLFDFMLNNIDSTGKGISFHDEMNRICAVVFEENDVSDGMNYIGELMDLINMEFHVYQNAEVGCLVNSFLKLYKSYNEAILQMGENLSQDGEENVILLHNGLQMHNASFWKKFQDIKSSVMADSTNTSKIDFWFDELKKILELYDVNEDIARICCYEFFMDLYFGLVTNGLYPLGISIDEYIGSIQDSDRKRIVKITKENIELVCRYKKEEVITIIENAKKYIDDHYCKKLSVIELASMVHVTSAHFSRLFKKETGLGCNEYIVGKRMEKAAYLLQNTNYKVNEIAQRIGYEDSNYFSLSFKKFYGKNPSEFRE